MGVRYCNQCERWRLFKWATTQEFQKISPKISKKLFNIKDISNPTEYSNEAELAVWQERYKAIIDIMGICALLTVWTDVNLFQPKDISDFYYLVTRESVSVKELLSRIKLQTPVWRCSGSSKGSSSFFACS